VKLNILYCLLFISLILSTACENQASDKEDKVVTGESLYLQHCVICHGKDGQLGAAQAKNLAVSNLSKEESLAFIKKGSPQMGMPAYENRMNAEELNALNDYVIGLRKE
jgi:cytochrome c6